MTKIKFYKKLSIIAIPIMIQYFISTSVNLMDSFMIGKLGDNSVAALGIANQYFFIFNLLLMGINSGCGVLISQFWGEKNIKSIKKILGIVLITGTIASLIFIFGARFFNKNIISIFTEDLNVIKIGAKYLNVVCISYIFMSISLGFGFASRGIEKTILPMVSSAIALIFNIVLNYTFIFGHFEFPKLGVLGAAYATLIARAIEMIFIISFIYFKNHILKSNLKELTNFSNEFYKKTLSVAFPVIINEICWGTGMIMYSIVYGKLGTKSIAAVQICLAVQNVFMTILFAVANASSVMVGNQVGKKDYNKAKYYASNFMKISIITSIIMAFTLYLSTSSILSIYNISPEVRNIAKYMLYITALIMPIKFINVVLIVGIMRGGGDAKNALIIELATMWLIGVPICFFSAFILKLSTIQVFALVTLEEIVRVIICLKRYKADNWINNVTNTLKKAS